MKDKLLRVLFALLCLSILVSGVASKEEDKGGEANVPEDDFVAVTDKGKDSELYKRYKEYEENSTLAFTGREPTFAEAFEIETNEGRAEIIGYIGDDDIVIIPSKIGENEVKGIRTGAFKDSKVRAVFVPDSVESIGQGAFEGCDDLATLRLPFIGDGGENSFLGYIFGAKSYDENAVKVPALLDMLLLGDGVSSVKENAFRGCKTLSAVILPEDLGEIGKLAFYECADLVYVGMGKVDLLGEYAFAHCTSLFDIDISGAGKVETGVLYSCTALNGITLNLHENDYFGRFFGAEAVEFNSDFVPLSLRRVTVAEGVEIIPDMAFSSCKYLTEVNLPSALRSVGVRAFYSCRSLAAIKLPEGVKSVGDDAFFYCDALAMVELPQSLESLGMQAFYGCESIKKINIPNSLKEIKSSTFYGCSSLESVTLGGTKKIGKDAFGKCDALNPVSCDEVEVADGNEALTGSSKEE